MTHYGLDSGRDLYLRSTMAEITSKRTGELVRGVFQILRDHPDGLPAAQVLAKLESLVPPTDFENTEYENSPGVRRYGKIVRFMTLGPVKAGWLIKSKGTWSVTPEGLAALDKFTDPADFMHEADRLYRVWKLAQPEPKESTSGTLEEAEEAAWSEVFGYLQETNPYDFQDLVAHLLRAMGYHVDWVSPPGPDRGLDILAYTDPVGASGPRIKVQVKRRADKINVDGVRSFMAILGAQDVGIFVSSGGFTSDAEREVRNQEIRRVSLMGPEKLFDLWVEHYGELSTEGRQLLPLRPVHFLAL